MPCVFIHELGPSTAENFSANSEKKRFCFAEKEKVVLLQPQNQTKLSTIKKKEVF